MVLPVADVPNLTLEVLKQENDFPYQLNYIRTKQSPNGKLRGIKFAMKRNRVFDGLYRRPLI